METFFQVVSGPLYSAWFSLQYVERSSDRTLDGVISGACASLRSKRKTALDNMNTKLGTHILYDSLSASSDTEVKRSKVKVTRLRKPSPMHGY